MKRLLLALTIAACCLDTSAQAACGDNPKTSFDLVASRLIADAQRGLIYASITDSNMVAVIDAATLTVTKKLTVGAGPIGMSISPDGKKLYVAQKLVKKIAVIDLTTLTVLPSLTIAEESYDIEAGQENRLYVTAWERDGDFLQLVQ